MSIRVRRNREFNFVLSESELELLGRTAADLGISSSALLRMAVNGIAANKDAMLATIAGPVTNAAQVQLSEGQVENVEHGREIR